MPRVRWIIAGVLGLAAVGLFVNWRLAAQTVNVVIVNSSGQPAAFSFQPALFADEASLMVGGCESKSIELRAGATWQLSADNVEVGSASVEVPFVVREVAFEVWLNPDGSSSVVPAYPIERQVDAPYPPGCASLTP